MPNSLKVEEGFTLIEILIVIVIISIVASAALLSINFNQNKQFETLSKQLANTITLAETEAMLRPATLGLLITENSYQFYEYHPDKDPEKSPWQPIDSHTLGLQRLSNNTELTLKINDKKISSAQPKIIISPGGDLTPFTILIGKKDSAPRYEIIGNSNGKVISEPVHEEE